MKLEIPEPLRLDQQELQVALQRAGMAGGKTSAAAKQLTKLLQPHLMKEEKDLLQTLGALLPMAKGEITDDMRELLPKTERLKTRVFEMVREHSAIIEAARKLLRVARTERKLKVAGFTERLLLRAWMDEVVFYPAAVVAGEYLRLMVKEKSDRMRCSAEPRVSAT